MKILVTGGGGYIGTELVRTLARNEEVEEVIVYDNLNRGNFNLFLGNQQPEYSKIKFVEGDILDSRLLSRTLEGVKVVFHLAAKVTTPFANVDPHFFEQVNHWGTAELVYAIEKSDVEHLIYTSSVGVYGSSDEEMTEESIPNPRTFYGISKFRGEQHVERLGSKIRTQIIRCGNVFGYSPSMRFDAVINKFVFEANFKKKIQIHGNGEQVRSFIHIHKLVAALTGLAHSDLGSGTYNLVEHNLTINEIATVLKEVMPEIEFLFVNQHLSLRRIRVRPNTQLNAIANTNSSLTFREEVEELIGHLRF